MSELHSLELERPAGEAPLTPGQVALYAKAKNAERPCEACGGKDFTMCPERDGTAGKSRGLVWLACDRCDAVRTFLRPPIAAWVKANRHA